MHIIEFKRGKDKTKRKKRRPRASLMDKAKAYGAKRQMSRETFKAMRAQGFSKGESKREAKNQGNITYQMNKDYRAKKRFSENQKYISQAKDIYNKNK